MLVFVPLGIGLDIDMFAQQLKIPRFIGPLDFLDDCLFSDAILTHLDDLFDIHGLRSLAPIG